MKNKFKTLEKCLSIIADCESKLELISSIRVKVLIIFFFGLIYTPAYLWLASS